MLQISVWVALLKLSKSLSGHPTVFPVVYMESHVPLSPNVLYSNLLAIIYRDSIRASRRGL